MGGEAEIMIKERAVRVANGWFMLVVNLLVLASAVFLVVSTILAAVENHAPPRLATLLPGIGLFLLSCILWGGFFALQPNEARVLLLFGAYKGTVRDSGFHWGNPFYSNGVSRIENGRRVTVSTPGYQSRRKISLRVRNFNSEKIKVNDKRGNPIEIGAVIVWRVFDTAQAAFDVENYENYVVVQSESALRHLASCYPYDHGEENETTLRGGADEVAAALQRELQERLVTAGVLVEEARLTHLAYAPEIASQMLRRQQAEAVIAARQKIVHGAVSMVEMALRELGEKNVVTLDEERKAAMVSNLMVVLCAESEVHPVVNTGTLYT